MGFGFYFDPINPPQLGVIKIDEESDKSGIFINLAPKNNQYEKTIKEEVQHAIQRIEGYARGSSVGAYRLATDSGVFGQVRLADNNLSSREVKEKLVNILYERTLGEIEGNTASENTGLQGLLEEIRSGPFLIFLTKDSLDSAVEIANFITDTYPDIPQSIVTPILLPSGLYFL
jgi:hypothetical protein